MCYLSSGAKNDKRTIGGNKVKKECSIVQDLLPLYAENMVSKQTAQYIEEHLQDCKECQAELAELKEEGKLSKIDAVATEQENGKPFKKMMKRMNRQFSMLTYTMLVFFIFLGFSFTAGENLMYNSLIMPIAGIFGYCVFRWKAVFKLPSLLLLIDLAVFAFQLVALDFAGTIIWTLIYSVFALIGITIAFLLHYAFRKENGK